MHTPPQDTRKLAGELLALVAYHSPINSPSARHELSRWVGWSVYPDEFSEAREQLVELGLIEYDPPPSSPGGELLITDTGFETLRRRQQQTE